MNQVQIAENLNLSEQELLLLSKSYRSCPLHPKNWIVSLSTNPNSTQFLQCARCLSQNPNQNTLDLISLIEENEKTLFHNWPVQGDNQLQQNLQMVFQGDFSVEGLQKKIISYFQNLRKSIELRINQKEQQMLQQAKSLWNIGEQVMIQYNQFAEKDNLKKIITQLNGDFNKQNLLLKETICRIFNNQNNYKQILQETVNRFENLKSLINFDTAQEINQNILQLLDSIDMFVIKNFQDIKVNTHFQNQDFKFDNLNNMRVRDLTTSQLIVKLISNQLNYCSEELFGKLQEIIKKLSLIIDQHNVKEFLNEDLLKIDFQKLESNQVDLIKNISEYINRNHIQNDQNNQNKQVLMNLISNKFNHCSQNFLNNLQNNFDQILPFINNIDFSNYLLPDKQSITGEQLTEQQIIEISNLTKSIETNNMMNNQNQIGEQESKLNQDIKNLISLIENKTNFCSAQFIQNAKEVTNNYKQIIKNLFLNENIFQNGHNTNINFSKFNENQLNNLQKLADKISELPLKFGDNYYDNQFPIKEQQNYSQLVSHLLGINKIMDKLLVDFPILETQQFTTLKLNIDFFKTNYNESQKLILEKNKQNNNYIVKQPSNLDGQIMTCNKLEPNLNYIFRCKINKYLDCINGGIGFGITETESIHNNWLGYRNCCFYSNSSYGLNKIIKGKNLYEVRDQINFIEIRVNVQTRKVLFMDYPHYKNINQVNEENILVNTDYGFGVYFYKAGDDYKVEIETYVVDDLSLDQYL
ncbi:von willebrand factor type A domain protein (macronuclear) [Tetrahymena thermophila SB210]|uniref:von willebrand factor type A domain protein n=1 Tax=Tetrahymena thermophila (strain SB210) TaxID=312017 RepID=Q22US4_TETTS|nr:von willebrand factor type A domain protein [Tetrahymena thermophila SB210]EAR89052.3 von willebrand factor type A domain protein [Tetrahymena thermophila SB210]|eukprot:XP_001009297.3 von willebrand factor type A domain protein [Tetrahymena thermophila SB210]